MLSIKARWAFTCLCLANGLVLYGSTLMGKHIAMNVAEFYGFPAQGHLMRNSGMLFVIAGFVNSVSLLQRNQPIDQLTYAVNVIVFAHYVLESFFFRSLHLITAVIFLLFVAYPLVHPLIPGERPKNYT